MSDALRIENLTKRYANGFLALNGINLTIAPGEFFALLGPNGAGKTTLIGIISSLIRKSSGHLAIFDQDIDREHAAAKQHIGLVPQEFNFAVFEKVQQIVMNQAGFQGLPRKLAKIRTEKYLKLLKLWDKRDAQARMLSGGMKRRLMIARALVHEPKLLILDEPTAGVDIEIRRSMWTLLRDINQQGTTIILTTHYLEEAENLCRHVAIIDHGKIIENGPMKNLLVKLNRETLWLYLAEPINQLPNVADCQFQQIDDTTLEVELPATMTINDLFSQLTAQQVIVNRFRNKVNRLEELFMRLVEEK